MVICGQLNVFSQYEVLRLMRLACDDKLKTVSIEALLVDGIQNGWKESWCQLYYTLNSGTTRSEKTYSTPHGNQTCCSKGNGGRVG
jgi:hypothetical protein